MVKVTDWRDEFRKLQLINEKLKERTKGLKIECGQQATKICVLNLRIKELEEAFGLAHSMLVSGEKPSEKSEAIFEQALKGN